MANKKNTRRALLTSVLSLILCVSMFVGTTFAWFTDTVTSGVNKIQSGNLDVELEYAFDPNGTYETVEGAGDLFVSAAGGQKGLWEPGHTEVAYLKVTNKGTLALQYNLSVSAFKETVGKNAEDEDIKLSEILKFAATEPSAAAPAAYTRETAQAAAKNGVKLNEYHKVNVSLAAGASQYIALVVYMPETVGNEANYRGTDIPTIEFAVTLLATQEVSESDSFGPDYDAEATYSNGVHWVDTLNDTADVNGGTFTYENEDGTFRASGEAQGSDVTVKVTHAAVDANFAASFTDDAVIVPYDIHVDGHKDGSDVTVEIFVGKTLNPAPAMYHNGVAIASDYDPATGFITFTTDSFSPFAIVFGADKWDGTADTTWYDEEADAFTLVSAEQFAGLAELVDGDNTFEGQTVKLGGGVDLAGKLFDPIGSYRNDQAFKGTFDGQGNVIKNLSQNTWELDNGYYYSDCGLGLFGAVEDATVKNLTVDGAEISGESAIVGIVAAVAGGDCTFENITVSHSSGADYQYYAGGIVGWASGNHTYVNCTVDASTTIAAQWGDFDNSTGGVIGGAGGNAKIFLKDCNVACRIDAYNDVTSTYQWYAYRRCGMLIGNTGKTVEKDGTTYAAAPQLTCENVTVTYGDWVNYTYCEFAGKNWPYVRVQAGVSNSAYSNPRYGHPTDANGNEVVDDNHVHNDGEDHQILCVFDQLYGGGQGVYGTASHDGVKVVYNNK